jgi:hypothetical protein
MLFQNSPVQPLLLNMFLTISLLLCVSGYVTLCMKLVIYLSTGRNPID